MQHQAPTSRRGLGDLDQRPDAGHVCELETAQVKVQVKVAGTGVGQRGRDVPGLVQLADGIPAVYRSSNSCDSDLPRSSIKPAQVTSFRGLPIFAGGVKTSVVIASTLLSNSYPIG